MKNRKRIAVIAAGISNRNYQHLFLEGILSQAAALNYDVAVFSPFFCDANETAYEQGENQIFNLIRFDTFDAVIYAPCSFLTDILRSLVQEKLAKECHIPIISLDPLETDDKSYYPIMCNDAIAFEQVVNHLIEHHGLTKIICLTGFKDNLQAELRLQGYKNAMKAHNLKIPDGYIIYGDFWKGVATELAEQIAAGTIEKPEAVVCACDSSAIALCNRLIELGISVPDEICVTGYDVGAEAADNIPSVTSYARPIVGMGIDSVLKIHKILTGEIAKPLKTDKGYLVSAESCGCGKSFQQKFEERQHKIKNIDAYEALFRGSLMAEQLNSQTTLKQLLTEIMNHFYLINGWRDWYLCLCHEWDNLSKNTENVEDYSNYTDTMHLCISCTDQIGTVTDEAFPLEDLLPIWQADRDEPKAYYFSPIHFNERCFGYTALGFGSQPMAYDSVYHSWCRNINNALEFIRIRNNMNSMNQRLFKNSIRDSLTGIYNRSGYKYYSEEIFEKAKHSETKKLFVLAVDLDCLKIINDTYGHVEGDNAISVVANALNTCFSFEEICARTGGDEFLVIGCAEYTDEILENYIAYIQNFFARYNASSEKPYQVEASLGYICEHVHFDDTLQKFMDEADIRMYANKVMRKKNRI